MDISEFDYDLPEHLIAQTPSRRRDRSRLLVFDRKTEKTNHLKFSSIESFLKKGDALIVNNTKVFKARLLGNRKTGALVEILLARLVDSAYGELWEGMARPSRRLKVGEDIIFDQKHHLELVKEIGEGRWQVRFESSQVRQRIVQKFGKVPLPPYISRSTVPSDLRRYQTVYASDEKQGAVAAPTAGFHFTPSLLSSIEAFGVSVIPLTLHVGPGTFRPVQVDNIADHAVDPEFAEITKESAHAINRVHDKGGKLFSVGTTSVRTLESAKVKNGEIMPFAGLTDLVIRPGYKFKNFDHLLTNFHLPRSSLLLLVAAFAGHKNILDLYKLAIAEEYRFYSYGDAMLLL